MNTEIVSYGGWQKNLRFYNDQVEAIVSLDVGPRILSYRLLDGGENVLKNYPEQLGQAQEDAWMIRGGHRLWIAPEDSVMTYHWDNQPVLHRVEDNGLIVIDSFLTEPTHIRKHLSLRLAEHSTKFTVHHTIVNEGKEPIQAATWGLTVMEPGGLEIIPQPALQDHPGNLLPNRNLVIWPYTDLSDSRLHLGKKFITLRQTADGPPFKFGLRHTQRWAGYIWGDFFFLKTFACIPGVTYPDMGCNFETFTNEEMIEIESLGPLANLGPGEATSHTEEWHLFRIEEPVQITSEDALQEWVGSFLKKAKIE